MASILEHQSADTDAAKTVYPGGIPQSAFDAVLQPLASARVLPPHCYTDPAFHAFEVNKVLSRNWIYAGRIDQVAAPGDYFTLTRYGETVIIVRDYNDEVKAFSAACRHRAFPVATGKGNCGRKGFTCPYHAWRYRLDGTLAAAPFMQDGFDPKDTKLPEFKVDVWLGFIFFSLNADIEPLSPQLKTLATVLEPFGLETMRSSTMREKTWPGNWKATLDNFTEAYHQPFIHPETFEPWAPARLGIYDDVDGPYNLFWLPSKDGGEVPMFFNKVRGLPDRYRTSFIVVNIFPMFHMLIDPSSVVLLDMEVQSVDQISARWDVLVTEDDYARPDFEAVRDQLTEALIPTWDEDEEACDRVRRGQASRFAEQGRFSWMEKSVHQLHHWLATQYTK